MKKIYSAILILFFTYIIYFSFVIPYEVKEISISLTVEDILGFNVTDKALAFGSIPPGGIGGKNVTINNDANVPEFVHITSSGSVSDWIMVSNNNFFIMPGEQKNMTVKAFVPVDAEMGDYDGMLKFQFKKII